MHRVDPQTAGLGQIQALLTSMTQHNEGRHLTKTLYASCMENYVISVSPSDSIFDEQPVMTETVLSPVSMRSSSGRSSDRDCEPISAANSFCAKLKVPN